MPRPDRVIVFLAADAAAAQAAETAFAAAAGRIGLGWHPRSCAVADLPPGFLSGVAVVVLVGEVALGVNDWEGRVERLAPVNLDEGVNRLLTRLLGGNDQAMPPPPAAPAAAKKVHTVKVSRETAGRRGKGVTVVSELPLTGDQLKELATRLKNACGTGGTAKDGRIEIQGDLRDRVAAELEKLGYRVKRAGG